MKIGDRYISNARFDSNKWEAKGVTGPHHIPVGVNVVVKELATQKNIPMVGFVMIGENEKESKIITTMQELFEAYFDKVN